MRKLNLLALAILTLSILAPVVKAEEVVSTTGTTDTTAVATTSTGATVTTTGSVETTWGFTKDSKINVEATTGSAKLTFDVIKDAQSKDVTIYSVNYSTTPLSGETDLLNREEKIFDLVDFTGTTVTLELTGLTANTTYYALIIPQTKDKFAGNSTEEFQIVTLSDVVAPAPVVATAEVVTGTEVAATTTESTDVATLEATGATEEHAAADEKAEIKSVPAVGPATNVIVGALALTLISYVIFRVRRTK